MTSKPSRLNGSKFEPSSKKNSSVKSESMPILVCAFYKFTTIKDYKSLRQTFLTQLQQRAIRGTLLLAEEGVNGTIAGSTHTIESFLDWLRTDSRFADIDCKFSYYSTQPFHRTKVKLKQEIVTMGVDGIDPNRLVGAYVEADQWNDLINDPQTLLIDVRNEYEIGIGGFANAVNPHTETFHEFPDYVKQNLDPQKHKKVAMYCTGGIRCEKASAYLKEQGFEDVYHLKGGILKYLESVDQKDSLWNGDCFVFDDRVAVNQDLEKGQYDQCHACRYPITNQDKLSEHYLPGVSCPRCYAHLTEQQKARFLEREKQMQLAKQRGEAHIGADSRLAAQKHRQTKQQDKRQQCMLNKTELS